MPELTEVLEKLPEDQRALITAAIEAEKTRGIEEARRKGAENSKLRTDNKKIVEALKGTLGEEFSLDTLADQLSKFKTQSTTVNTSEYVPIKDFELLKKQVTERDQKLEKAANEIKVGKMVEQLNKVMGENFLAKDLYIKELVSGGKVRLTDGGELVLIDGDDEIDAASGLEVLKKWRPDLLKNITKPGAGSSGSKDKSNNKSIAYSEWLALDGKKRAQMLADGYQLTS